MTTPIKQTTKSKRMIAAVIDSLLALVFAFLVSLPLLITYINSLNNVASFGLTIIAMLTGAIICLGAIIYEVLLPYLWFGQSIGMRIVRIKLVDEKGLDLKLRQLIIRAATVVFVFITTCGVSLIAEIFIVSLSNEHRSFNDTVSRVYCVDIAKPSKEEK